MGWRECDQVRGRCGEEWGKFTEGRNKAAMILSGRSGYELAGFLRRARKKDRASVGSDRGRNASA